MLVTQIKDIVNQSKLDLLGLATDWTLADDLSNVVEIGKQLNQLGDATVKDNYVKSIVDKVGRMVFVERNYESNVPSIYRDTWEYGSIMEKVRMQLPDARDNDSWNLQDGKQYEVGVFHSPNVEAKYYNGLTTFEIPISYAQTRAYEAFNSPEQLNSFLSMIYNGVQNALTLYSENLALKTINTLMAFKIANETARPGGVVHLISEYNDKTGSTLNANDARTNVDFLKYTAQRILNISDYMKKYSSAFNLGEIPTFSPKDRQHLVMLSDMSTALDVYLQSDTYHNQYTDIGARDVIPAWQKVGQAYNFEYLSQINITHNDLPTENKTLKKDMIIGVLFDVEACAINLFNRRTTSQYTASAEFFTDYHKQDARYLIDTQENAVVFILD